MPAAIQEQFLCKLLISMIILDNFTLFRGGKRPGSAQKVEFGHFFDAKIALLGWFDFCF